MAISSQDTAIRTGRITRTFIYLVLTLFALFYMLPLYVMAVNSLKPLSEITGGGMMALPQVWTIEPWLKAWSTAQVGVQATGLKPYFWNSISMVVPAVAISTILGALNGYVLTKWRFKGDTLVFGFMLFACFIPFQIVLIPMAAVLGVLGIAGTTAGLVLVHVVYGIGFTTLYFRNYYAVFPTELIRAAQIDGAHFFQIFWRILLPSSGPIAVVSVIWQFTNIWNDFIFGASFSSGDGAPMTVALNNLVQSST
ncbi:MAG: carbohydrate ABC transporter permease, partial [Rhodobacteraceae bacterium]|nr:carbohydrate ABC transporter permease [Paracoccaceae bacterium]